MSLQEIEKIIAKHVGDQRVELVEYYRRLVDESIDVDTQVDARRIKLVCHAAKLLLPAEREILINKAINVKALQFRTFILNNFKGDLTLEKTEFTFFSSWICTVIDEIKKLQKEATYELVEQLNKKVCEEIRLIFCSNEKFNTAGNQLVLDTELYKRTFEGFEAEKAHLHERICRNFNPGKMLSEQEIDKAYKEIDECNRKLKDERKS